jgi:TonB family protein
VPALQNERAIARAAALRAESVPFVGEPVSHMWIQVSPDGHPGQIRVHGSSGYDQLDRIATSSVARAVFKPGSFDGIPIVMWVAIPITFTTAGDER